PIVFSDNMALAVIAASGGYPEAYEKGMKISGLEALEQAIVFHAGTKIHNNEFLTAGGRVLAVVALEQDIENLRKIAYDSMKMIQFEKKYFRSDIGLDLIS
ncbi:MAG: phosphoribosylglycinamide synthetase C domain-containing protein, partial [Bacteroidota bacterium]